MNRSGHQWLDLALIRRRLPFSLYPKVLLFSIGILSVSFSLLVRLVYRGPYYPGWDVLGPAQGLYLVSNHSAWDSLTQAFHSTRHFELWNNTNSVLYTLIPGYLGSLWPWQYWGHLLTFILFLLTLGLILKIAQLQIRQSWILLLTVGVSPTLLSFSLVGYPYITGFLPHALALWCTLSQRFYRRPVLTLFLCALSVELSWHLYELGKTVFIVFLGAGVIFRSIPILTRMIWILTGIAQLVLLQLFSSGNVSYMMNFQSPEIGQVGRAVFDVANAILVTQTLDLPILFILGTGSFLFFVKNRWFFLGLFLFQVGLFLLLALQGPDHLLPRRFLMVEFYCVLTILYTFREYDFSKEKLPSVALVALLLIGNIWQTVDLLNFVQVPVNERRHPLPFTNSVADYAVPASSVNWYLELKSWLSVGHKVVLIYNFSSHPENTTDPAAVLERLYLDLGHDRFVSSVYVFGSVTCRYSCVPIKPLGELKPFLESMGSESLTSPETFKFYYYRHLHTFYRPHQELFESEGAWVFSQIRERFLVRIERQDRKSDFLRFTIVKRKSRDSSGGVVIEAREGWYRLPNSSEVKTFTWKNLPVDFIWTVDPQQDSPFLVKRPWDTRPFTAELAGILHVYETGMYDFVLGADDGASLSLGSRIIMPDDGPHPFQLSQRSLRLERGDYPLTVRFSDLGNEARLLFDVSPLQETIIPSGRREQVFETVPFSLFFPEGLEGRYYEGVSWSGDSRRSGPEIQLGRTLELLWTVTPGERQKPWPWFSLRLTGTMQVRESGTYRFELGSDDGSFLYLDGELLLDNGGNHSYREKGITQHLESGKFPFRLDYFDIMADAVLKLRVKRLVTTH